tara:strand:+ start:289 stop:639 length:351 start_codon:yes stop_codon:yes gene_type:complete
MVKKIKTCVFISGNGSNLSSLIKSSRDYSFPIKIELIITNNKRAKGLNFAKKHNIPFNFFSYDNKKSFERNALNEIKKKKNKISMFGRIYENTFKKFYKRFWVSNYKYSSIFIAQV